MAYCIKCGSQISDEAVVCPKCGVQVKPLSDTTNQIDNSDGIGFGFLGFFVPIAGLILYLIWKDDKPKKAKAAGIGALINLAFDLVVGIIWFLFLVIVYA